jgi:hypothetical protein
MEAIFAPIQDVPDVPALDVMDTLRSGLAVSLGRVEGDFAAGLRLRPHLCRPGDFATGLRAVSPSEQRCDFATGLRTLRTTGLNRGGFATGQRGADDSADRRSAPPAVVSRGRSLSTRFRCCGAGRPRRRRRADDRPDLIGS